MRVRSGFEEQRESIQWVSEALFETVQVLAVLAANGNKCAEERLRPYSTDLRRRLVLNYFNSGNASDDGQHILKENLVSEVSKAAARAF